MSAFDPDLYLAAWNFAADAHAVDTQKVPGTERPYITHVGAVAMEVCAAVARRGDVADPDLAVQCALLHDVVEDTSVEVDEIRKRFGDAVADGVAALTKAPSDKKTAEEKSQRMEDSLARIRAQPKEVWMVKLADRITNLQPPPAHWDAPKIAAYRQSAERILEVLKDGCPVLSARLADKISRYPSPQ